jgi:hypothetical protein
VKNFQELYEKWQSLPTIMDFDDEISFIHDIMSLPVECFRHNIGQFNEILGDVLISHQDNGIFELTKGNEQVFLFFGMVI